MLGAVVSVGIGSMAALANGIFHRIPAVAWLLFALYQLVLNAAEGLVFAGSALAGLPGRPLYLASDGRFR